MPPFRYRLPERLRHAMLVINSKPRMMPTAPELDALVPPPPRQEIELISRILFLLRVLLALVIPRSLSTLVAQQDARHSGSDSVFLLFASEWKTTGPFGRLSASACSHVNGILQDELAALKAAACTSWAGGLTCISYVSDYDGVIPE